MSKELIINASLPELRICLLEDNKIQDLLIERPAGRGIAGNIYKGKVTRVLPGMQAAFVDIGLEKAAFLYVDDIFHHDKFFKEEEEEANQAAEDATPSEDDVSATASESNGESASAEADSSDEDAADAQSERDGQDAHEAAEWSAEDAEEEVEEAREGTAEASDASDEEFSEESENSAEDSESDAESDSDSDETSEESTSEESEASLEAGAATTEEGAEAAPLVEGQEGQPEIKKSFKSKRRQRGRRQKGQPNLLAQGFSQTPKEPLPQNYYSILADEGDLESDRSAMNTDDEMMATVGVRAESTAEQVDAAGNIQARRPEFREPRSRDRRIRPKQSRRQFKAPVQINDLLKEGQEVLVQVSKDPIATKGARLTCHITLAGRHLVCMPTVDHVGVSRRIERDDERRKLREFVEKNRPKKMGFIVRTATGGKDPEHWVKEDIDYLAAIWTEVREKMDKVSAPAMVYEDLDPILRSVRDWVNEDIDKIVVDSRYQYNTIREFVSRFMPSMVDSVELYQGDIPIYDAYGISTELHRALERKVWLKSGGYIVVDQAEALVAIDVNTGRFVGKKNLEDTILKTNLEAVEEVAYQMRLRNCGGIIIIDLIDMEREENKLRVYRALEEAVKRDRSRPTIVKISELGLIEMTRKRTRDTMVRALCEPCSHCEGKGFVKSKHTVAYEIMREIEREAIDRDVKKILIQAHKDVIDILSIDERETVDLLEKKYQRQIFLQVVEDFHQERYEVVGDRGNSRPAAKVFQPRKDDYRESRDQREARRSNRPSRNQQKDKDKESSNEESSPRSVHSSSHSNSNANANSEIEATAAVDNGEPKEPPKSVWISRTRPAPVVTPVAQAVGDGAVQPQQAKSAPSVEDEDRQPAYLAREPGPRVKPIQSAGGEDDDDRLAFLRAQAAQDAALAMFGTGNNGAPVVPGGVGAGMARQNQGRGPRGPGRNQNNKNNGKNRRPPHQAGGQRMDQRRFRPQPNGGSDSAPVEAVAAPVAASGGNGDGTSE